VTGGQGGYDQSIKITPQDLNSVFAGLGPSDSPEYEEAERDAEHQLQLGLCYGFSVASWGFFGNAHGKKISLAYANSPGFSATPGSEPYPLGEAGTGSHALTHMLLRGAISQYAPEAQQAMLPVESASTLSTALNAAFSSGQPAPISLFYRYNGASEGHTVLAYDYQSPDPTTGEGLAVDVVDPNVPWKPGRSPSDYEYLQIHVKADGSWTFAGTVGSSPDFGAALNGGKGSLLVMPAPKDPGGLHLHTQLAGDPMPVGLTTEGGATVSAISYSDRPGHGVPPDVSLLPIADDGPETQLSIPNNHPEATITVRPGHGSSNLDIAGTTFLDESHGNGKQIVTVNTKSGAVSATRGGDGSSLTLTRVLGDEQRSARVHFFGKVLDPQLRIEGDEVILKTAGGSGHATLAVSSYAADGQQTKLRPQTLSLRGRSRSSRHLAKLKRRNRRRRHKRHKRH
jgi:hypothetical protein